jgi:molybdopterin/thiamine biosynthesis adenylyltransferase
MENKEITTIDILAKFSQKKQRKPTVCYPAELEDKNCCCELWGYYQDESNYYNITLIVDAEYPINKDSRVHALRSKLTVHGFSKDFKDLRLLGYYVLGEITEQSIISDGIYGQNVNGEIKFIHYTHEDVTFDSDEIKEELKRGTKITPISKYMHIKEICQLEKYKLKMDIFSRNTGILESDTMLKKGAVIIGCGSVGSLVALELARAGVGRFFLIDMDIMSYHNICRHQCGVRDVGKFKTTAVKERILQINPTAEVHTENKMIQEIALGEFEKFCNEDCIMVGCADNREGDLYADAMIAKPYKMPFVSIGCWERAFAGEVFYCLPEGMPAYSDFVAALGESSGRTTANTHLYMGEVGTFEPGISVDINFVTTIAVKLILDLLNRNNENYTQRLINSLTQYTLICNTNNPKIGGEMAEIFSYPLQVTRSIKVEYANK